MQRLVQHGWDPRPFFPSVTVMAPRLSFPRPPSSPSGSNLVVTTRAGEHGTQYDLREAAPSPQARWPDKQGVVLLKHIWSIYVIDRSRGVAYFDEQGTRLLTRHPLNTRDVDGMSEEMADLILKVGVQSDKRGKPILMPQRDEAGVPGGAFTFKEFEKCWVIGGGTMVDGVYIAAARDPSNPQILQTLSQGLEDAIVVHPSTPSDIVAYVTDEHNSFHLGSPSTFLQGLQKVAVIEAAWEDHKDKERFSSRREHASIVLPDVDVVIAPKPY